MYYFLKTVGTLFRKIQIALYITEKAQTEEHIPHDQPQEVQSNRCDRISNDQIN